tara:strand:+ start:72 stop:1142 length:1071 start_codon:yes stop_codon:yes gene_type:complete
MLTQLMPLAAALVAQASSSETSLVTIAMTMAFIAAAGGCFMLYSRLGALKTQVDGIQASLSTKDQELRDTAGREKKLQKDLTEKNESYTKLKHDLAGQKKKLHTAHEETKELKKNHKEQVEKLQRGVNSKPAFQEAAKSEPKAKPVEVKAEPKAEPKAEATAEATAEVKAAPDPRASAELDALKATNEKLKTRLNDNKQYMAKAKREVKDSRQRVERYRRIDIITRNRTELLEDKLLTLGRDHYDIISEIAVLKGEVQPPRPRELVEAEKRAEEARLEAEAKLKEQEFNEDDAPITLELELDADLDSELLDPEVAELDDELEHVEAASEDADDTVELDATQVIAEPSDTVTPQPSA